MIVFTYNLTLFTVQEIEVDKISSENRAIKITGKGKRQKIQVFHKWSPTREFAVKHVLEALNKELKRRQDGILKLEKIKQSYE